MPPLLGNRGALILHGLPAAGLDSFAELDEWQFSGIAVCGRSSSSQRCGHRTACLGERNMRVTIRKKLLINFGLILAIMVLAFAFSMITTWRERSTKAAASNAMELSQAAGVARFQIMQSRFGLEQLPADGRYPRNREAAHRSEQPGGDTPAGQSKGSSPKETGRCFRSWNRLSTTGTTTS